MTMPMRPIDPDTLFGFCLEYAMDRIRIVDARGTLEPFFRVAYAGRFSFLPEARAHDEAPRIQQAIMEGLGIVKPIHMTFRPATKPFAHMPRVGSLDWRVDVRKVYHVPLASYLGMAYPALVRPLSTSQVSNVVYGPEHVAYDQVAAMVRYALGAQLQRCLVQSVDERLITGEFADWRLELWNGIERLIVAYVIAVIRDLPAQRPLATLVQLLPECIPAAHGFCDPQPWQVLCGE